MSKRAFDLVIAALLLILLSPAMALTALAVKMWDGSPVLYQAERIGREGRGFTMYKFRSMGEVPGAPITVKGDPRVTPLGRLLRRTKLDELPQLYNVLRGDMSLVGPRPEDPQYVKLYSTEYETILRLRPGITGPAAIRYTTEESVLASFEDAEAAYQQIILPAKLALDMDYVACHSLKIDVAVLFRTASVAIRILPRPGGQR